MSAALYEQQKCRSGNKNTFKQQVTASKNCNTPLTPTTVASDHDVFVSMDDATLDGFSTPCLDCDSPDFSATKTVVENMELLLQEGVAAIQITTANDDDDSWTDEDFDFAIDFDYGTRSSFNLKSCPAQRRSS